MYICWEQIDLVMSNYNILNAWMSSEDMGRVIPYCKGLTAKTVCLSALIFVKKELKSPKDFYWAVYNMATSVAEEFFSRWSSGLGSLANWEDYIKEVSSATVAMLSMGYEKEFLHHSCKIADSLKEDIWNRYLVRKDAFDTGYNAGLLSKEENKGE